MSAIAWGAQPVVATRTLAGVSIPDTPVITRASEFAREKSEPYLFNLIEVGQSTGLRTGKLAEKRPEDLPG